MRPKQETMSYAEAMRAAKDAAIAEQEGKFYEMAKKPSESPFGEVSTAPSKTVTGASQPLGASGKTFTGSGGYEYGVNADGSFMILKSGRGAAPGTVVKEGMRGYDAIKREYEAVKAGKPVSSKPRSSAPKSTSRGVNVTDVGLTSREDPDTKLLRKSAMRRQEGRERLTRDLMLKGMPLDEAQEFAKRFLRPGGNDSGEPEIADTRMARK